MLSTLTSLKSIAHDLDPLQVQPGLAYHALKPWQEGGGCSEVPQHNVCGPVLATPTSIHRRSLWPTWSVRLSSWVYLVTGRTLRGLFCLLLTLQVRPKSDATRRNNLVHKWLYREAFLMLCVLFSPVSIKIFVWPQWKQLIFQLAFLFNPTISELLEHLACHFCSSLGL